MALRCSRAARFAAIAVGAAPRRHPCREVGINAQEPATLRRIRHEGCALIASATSTAIKGKARQGNRGERHQGHRLQGLSKAARGREYRRGVGVAEPPALAQTIRGLQAGKDVHCEKPLSHNVWEGRQAVEAARKYSKNIVQAGTQNRSSDDIKEAIAYIRSGKLGKIHGRAPLLQRDSIGKTTGSQPVPASTTDLWTGPAPLTPPRRNGSKGPVHYDWHWFWNYGGGDITNQGIHQMDVARWFLGEPGLPPTVMSFGGRFGYLDDAETPNTLISVLGYEKAPLIFEVRGLPTKAGCAPWIGIGRGGRVVVQCEMATCTQRRRHGGIYDNDNNDPEAREEHLGRAPPHFVKAVRDRKVVNGLVEECHYSSALCH